MPDLWMDVDAALAEVPVNIMPLLDDTDFKSREESVAYNAAGLELIWHFTTTAGATSATVVTPTTGGAYDWAHQDGGMYTIEIPASGGASINNDTEGFGWFTGVATGVLPWRGPVIGFRAAALNNALIDGGDTLDVNVTEISGDSTAADNCELMFDGTGYAGGTTKLGVDAVAISGDSTAADNLEAACDGNTYNVGGGAVVAASVTGAVGSVTGAVGSVTGAVGSVTGAVGSIAAGGIAAASFAAGAINAAAIADSAIDAATFAAGAITAAAIATGAIDADAIADNAIDAGAIAADAITAAKIAADVTTEIQSGLATAAELAKVPKSDGSASWNATALAAIQQEATDALNAYDPPTNAEMEARTLVAASYFDPAADTVAHVTLVDTTTTNTDMITAATIADAVWDEASAGHTDAGKAGQQLWTDIDAILVDTTEIGVAGAGLTAIDLPDQTMNITGNITGNLSGSVGSVTGAVGSVMAGVALADDAITAAKFDETTAFPLKSADTGATAVARTGADADTLETLSDQLDDVPTVLEFEARTLVAADYVVVGDTLAAVTTVGSVTGAVGSVTGAVGSVTGNVGGNVAGSVASVTGNVGGNVVGSVGSVTGAVGSVTGNVGGNVTGSVGSVAAGGITAASIATGAIDADALAADAVTEIQSGLATAAAVADVPTVAEFEARTLVAASYFDPAADTVAHVTLVDTTTTNTDMVTVGDVADAVWDEALAGHAGAGTAGAALSAASAPTAADVADAVWDEALAGHAVAGSAGAALSAAGAAGDPWSTALPGAYADGTAGDIIGNLVTDVGSLVPAVAVATTTAASVSTGALSVRTHHTLSQALTSTTTSDLSAATKLWLVVKAEKDDTDAQSVVFIEATAGLTYLAGAAYTTVAHGSLTVGGVAGAWTITVAIDEVATGLLTAYADGMLWAECKALVAGSTVAVWDGVCDVARGIVNATS